MQVRTRLLALLLLTGCGATIGPFPHDPPQPEPPSPWDDPGADGAKAKQAPPPAASAATSRKP